MYKCLHGFLNYYMLSCDDDNHTNSRFCLHHCKEVAKLKGKRGDIIIERIQVYDSQYD